MREGNLLLPRLLRLLRRIFRRPSRRRHRRRRLISRNNRSSRFRRRHPPGRRSCLRLMRLMMTSYSLNQTMSLSRHWSQKGLISKLIPHHQRRLRPNWLRRLRPGRLERDHVSVGRRRNGLVGERGLGKQPLRRDCSLIDRQRIRLSAAPASITPTDDDAIRRPTTKMLCMSMNRNRYTKTSPKPQLISVWSGIIPTTPTFVPRRTT